jgi:hypothetical protein
MLTGPLTADHSFALFYRLVFMAQRTVNLN